MVKFLRNILIKIAVVLTLILSTPAVNGDESTTVSGISAADNQTALAETPRHLRLLSGPPGGQWDQLAERMAEILSRQVLRTIKRVGSGLENIYDLNAIPARGDIALTTTCLLGLAASGEAEFENIAVNNVKVMAIIYPQLFYLLVGRNVADKYQLTDLTSLLAVKNKIRLASLPVGTSSEFLLNLVLTYGYQTDLVKLRDQGWDVIYGNYPEISDDFANGKIDCFAYSAGINVPLIHTLEKHREIVILPISTSVLDRLCNKFKFGTYMLQPNQYKGVKTPQPTLADATCLIARADLPENLVYKITKILWMERGKLAEKVKDYGFLSPHTAMPAALPVAEGAARYWNELNSR